MKFIFEDTGKGAYLLLVPPANRPLLDGASGRAMEFTASEINVAQLLGRSRLTDILEALVRIGDNHV